MGAQQDCPTEFWMAFYHSCMLGVVPFIRHDFQAVSVCAQSGYKLVISTIAGRGAIWLNNQEFDVYIPRKTVVLKALADFNLVDTDELLAVLEAFEFKEVPSKTSEMTAAQSSAPRYLKRYGG